jgi:tripartite-type tricarboxylate transporter receptor subunit TctC
MQLKFALFVAVALALPSPPCAAQDVADFYKGKQISIIVGFTPGGSSSLYAQALARHMGRYLPGNPSLIVQHVPGAGGLVAQQCLQHRAA